MSIKALYLNTSLKTGDETSNTEALMQKSMDILKSEGVETELLRIADYHVIPGMSADNGQSKYFNKVFGTVVTGKEDGAKEAGGSILSRMANLGFTIPPNTNTYWVGEAGPGPFYIEAGQENAFTQNQIQMKEHHIDIKKQSE